MGRSPLNSRQRADTPKFPTSAFLPKALATRDTQQSSFLTSIPAVMLSPRHAIRTGNAPYAGISAYHMQIPNKMINFFMAGNL